MIGINTKSLDDILVAMVDTVNNSREEIVHIVEKSRNDYNELKLELDEVKEQVSHAISEGDILEMEVKKARAKLASISHLFKELSENEVKIIYHNAHNMQLKLELNREQERQLRARRHELQKRLLSIQDTMDKAENLVSQTSIVLNYLSSDLRDIGNKLMDAEEKQQFGLKVIEAQEEERKRISREIHDGPAQMLANILLRTDIIDKSYRQYGIEQALVEIKNLKGLVRSSLYEVRRIIYDLRPMALDDLGLVPTLNKYLNKLEEYNEDVSVHFKNIGMTTRLPTDYEVALFRLVQESVQNSMKHASATEIEVKLEIKDCTVNAIIKDNGTGFDTTQKKEGSFGILGMKERVKLLEGNIQFESQKGNGTIVLIAVPLKSNIEMKGR